MENESGAGTRVIVGLAKVLSSVNLVCATFAVFSVPGVSRLPQVAQVFLGLFFAFLAFTHKGQTIVLRRDRVAAMLFGAYLLLMALAVAGRS